MLNDLRKYIASRKDLWLPEILILGSHSCQHLFPDSIVTHYTSWIPVVMNTIARADVVFIDVSSPLEVLKSLEKALPTLQLIHIVDRLRSQESEVIQQWGFVEVSPQLFLKEQQIDVVIPLGPHDVGMIESVVRAVKKNICFLSRIYIITPSGMDTPECSRDERVILVPEHIFPFQKEDVAEIHGTRERNGWYLQQLLKLYAGMCISGIRSDYLVIDADTIFVRPLYFKTLEGAYIYTKSDEHHQPYYQHLERLHPVFKGKEWRASGIAHHMIMNTRQNQQLFRLVESHHDKPFWKAFLECVDEQHRDHSGASEYEMLFHYGVEHWNVRVRTLRWMNRYPYGSMNMVDYYSDHWYSRNNV